MNVVIDKAHADLSGASDRLASGARLIGRRDVLIAADLAAVRRNIEGARALLDEVEAEINAPRTGLTIDRAGWGERNEIAAERAASNGVA